MQGVLAFVFFWGGGRFGLGWFFCFGLVRVLLATCFLF